MPGNVGQVDGIKPGKLFIGSCTALIATAMTFAATSSIMGALKEQFLLSNEQAGYIGGATLWGFPLSILIFGSLCSVLGMRFLLRLAFVFFFAGVSIMIAANGFWMLFIGALTIAFANGLVEGACNPLVATIFPTRKVEKLNQFHVWFPGGIAIGGLLFYAMDMLIKGQLYERHSWQIKLGMILVPAVAYAIIMINEKFPETERAQSGVSFFGMVKFAFTRPLFWLLFICMMLTASVELGPNRWIPTILDAAGIPGMLVLVWTSVLMAILRYNAGKISSRLSPTGLLLCSSVLGGVGLWSLSFANSYATVFIADTVFAFGVCYFWPTMLGVMSERVPKGGEFALAMLGAAGNLAVGLLTIPQMGHVGDYYGHQKFAVAETTRVIEQVVVQLPKEKANIKDQDRLTLIDETLTLANKVLDTAKTTNALPPNDTANVFRSVLNSVPGTEIAKTAKTTLDPAEAFGGRMSFRWVSAMAIFLVLVFGSLTIRDVASGGYKAEKIAA
jgi:fucose permease